MRDAAGAGVAGVLRVYEERAAELGLAAALRRGPRCPSLADVLEGLQDVERYYRHLYPSAGLPGQCWRRRLLALLGVFVVFLFVVLTGHKGTWRSSCCCSASAVTT